MAVSSVEQDRAIVTRASKFCIVVMSLITLVVLAYAIGDISGMLCDWDMKTARVPLAYKAFMSTYRLAIFVLFDVFYLACGKGSRSPFGRAQIVLLAVNGLLIALYGFIGEFGSEWVNSLPKLMYMVDPVSTQFSYPGAWLLYVGFGAFLVCLAVMFHYANELYQDSDSII
uniref:hypothetical protein n=1 Tax=Parolsenella massiliensis TaxID=1871022 RepID=UPI000933BFBC|nr:hypothetical protein [Parolsenella massiliensis]